MEDAIGKSEFRNIIDEFLRYFVERGDFDAEVVEVRKEIQLIAAHDATLAALLNDTVDSFYKVYTYLKEKIEKTGV